MIFMTLKVENVYAENSLFFLNFGKADESGKIFCNFPQRLNACFSNYLKHFGIFEIFIPLGQNITMHIPSKLIGPKRFVLAF